MKATKPQPRPPVRIDPENHRILLAMLQDDTAEQLSHLARTGSPAVRAAAAELLASMLEGSK